MDLNNYFYENGKTHYQILNEEGNKTTIAIEKWAADILQHNIPNVHEWIKEKYDYISLKRPDLTRKVKGNGVRQFAIIEASKSNIHKKIINTVL